MEEYDAGYEAGRDAAREWEGIAVAPRDGTEILSWSRDDGLNVAFWRNGWVRKGDDYDIVVEPTHWQEIVKPRHA